MIRRVVYLLLALGTLPTAMWAAAAPAQPATKPAAGSKVTVAILDFDAAMPGNAEMGKQIGEILALTLRDEEGFTLVDRAAIAQTIKEIELNLTGLVDAKTAITIGRQVGA